jgi:hypothetical protein
LSAGVPIKQWSNFNHHIPGLKKLNFLYVNSRPGMTLAAARQTGETKSPLSNPDCQQNNDECDNHHPDKDFIQRSSAHRAPLSEQDLPDC